MTKAQKWGISYKDILNEKRVNLNQMNKEQLRRYLVVLNEEANNRLKSLTRVNPEKFDLYMRIDEAKQRINIKEKTYLKYKTTRNMTKKDIIDQLVSRSNFLSLKSSTFKGFQEVAKKREKYLYESLQRFTNVPLNKMSVKPSANKMAKIMNRLEDENLISQSGNETRTVGELGSPEVAEIAYQTMYDNPYRSIDDVWSMIVEQLSEYDENVFRNKTEDSDALRLWRI